MRKNLLYIKMGFMSALIYRVHFILLIVTNILAMFINYFLWKAIYSTNYILNGMTFNKTFIYLSFAITLFMIYQTWLDWWISRSILTGNIVVEILKPVNYFSQQIYSAFGEALANFVIIGIPSTVLFLLFFTSDFTLGWNYIFFLCSVLIGIIMSNTIDFAVGLTSFSTESIWGICATKEAIILFLSGAVVPLSFFPESVRQVLLLLPFQAIYYTPLTLLTAETMPLGESVRMLGIQIFWCLLLFYGAKLFFKNRIKALTVNGG